jgi:myosin heavy subunit
LLRFISYQIKLQALRGDNDKSEIIPGEGIGFAAQLFSIEQSALSTALTERTVTARNETYKVWKRTKHLVSLIGAIGSVDTYSSNRCPGCHVERNLS